MKIEVNEDEYAENKDNRRKEGEVNIKKQRKRNKQKSTETNI